MTVTQDKTIAELERRLGESRAFSERFAEEHIPGFHRDVGLRDIDADHLILLLSDLDIHRRHGNLSN